MLTGAGCSTESNLPDYRSPSGAYSRGFKPMTHQLFMSGPASQSRYWCAGPSAGLTLSTGSWSKRRTCTGITFALIIIAQAVQYGWSAQPGLTSLKSYRRSCDMQDL